MIFINTRPLDEAINEDRRPSKAPSHQSVHPEPRKIHMNRIALCLLTFYILVSIIPVLLHYPLSLISLIVPCILFIYAVCTLRSESRSNQWPCCLVAIIGILIKIAAVVIYISIFPVKDTQEQVPPIPTRLQARADASMNQYRLIFYVVVLALEIFLLVVGGCLKWHLSALEGSDISVQKQVKRSSTAAASSQALIPGNPSARQSLA
ncbi:unnamed protein product [Cylicocyclus nassatus]|uniref:Uncharacterized protein n=1 Tax=Cylicocyclus nassatus TaxID=53992 RepID=A0AA36GD24_CYLNA|nr:unnamed protein product [Cylicocyclus nassatus]